MATNDLNALSTTEFAMGEVEPVPHKEEGMEEAVYLSSDHANGNVNSDHVPDNEEVMVDRVPVGTEEGIEEVASDGSLPSNRSLSANGQWKATAARDGTGDCMVFSKINAAVQGAITPSYVAELGHDCWEVFDVQGMIERVWLTRRMSREQDDGVHVGSVGVAGALGGKIVIHLWEKANGPTAALIGDFSFLKFGAAVLYQGFCSCACCFCSPPLWRLDFVATTNQAPFQQPIVGGNGFLRSVEEVKHEPGMLHASAKETIDFDELDFNGEDGYDMLTSDPGQQQHRRDIRFDPSLSELQAFSLVLATKKLWGIYRVSEFKTAVVMVVLAVVIVLALWFWLGPMLHAYVICQQECLHVRPGPLHGDGWYDFQIPAACKEWKWNSIDGCYKCPGGSFCGLCVGPSNFLPCYGVSDECCTLYYRTC